MRPIPLKNLPQKVTYQKFLGNTGEGDTFDDKIMLKNVKLENYRKIITDTNKRELVASTLMFYDYINSKGLRTQEPVINSLIEYDDKKYRIISVDTLYDNNSVHHYEVILQ